MTTEVATAPIRHRVGPDGTLALRNIAGSVQLIGTDGDEIEVVARHVGGGEQAPKLSVRRYDGGIEISPERQGRTFFGMLFAVDVPDIDFEIELPRSARVEVNAVSADVAGGELHGVQSYTLVSGDLQLSAAGGRIDAKSVSGSVRVHAATAVELNAATTSGEIELEGDDIQLARLRSISGDAAISGRLAAGPEHRVETVSGDLQLAASGGVTVEASGPMIDVQAHLPGSRSLGQRGLVVGDGSARLRFRSMSGEVRTVGVQAARPLSAFEQADSLEILRALERGDIDVEEASRKLAGSA